MPEKSMELTDINIDQLFDELEAEDKRRTLDERQADENKFRQEYPELYKDMDAIVSKLNAFQSISSLPEKTPKEIIVAVLNKARNSGIAAIITDTTTLASDDQDCYPRGIILTIEGNRPEWELLKKLQKEISWLSVNKRQRRLSISPDREILRRLTQFGYQSAVADSLNESGITCYADVHWRG